MTHEEQLRADTETAAFLQASCWELSAARCGEHYRASVEQERATLEHFLQPSIDSSVRLMVAEVALRRAEGRLK